jgi:hypothetical protein
VLQNTGKTGISQSVPPVDKNTLLSMQFYQEKFSTITRDRWIINDKLKISDKEKALITLRDLLLAPGVVKHIQNINEINKNDISSKNLEKYFPEIINEHFDSETAKQIFLLVYTNENKGFTLTAVVEAFYALNINNNLKNFGIKLNRPDGTENCISIVKTTKSNINPDFYVQHKNKNFTFYKDHTAPEIHNYKNNILIPGELEELTTRELMKNKGCYDISNTRYNQIDLQQADLNKIMIILKGSALELIRII